jgi:hypothetical protein
MILWTCLTGVLFLTLLGFLTWALAQIHGALAGIRDSLEKIAMGVRAIEVETSPLPPSIAGIAQSLTAIAGGLRLVRDHLASSEAALPDVARRLGLL